MSLNARYCPECGSFDIRLRRMPDAHDVLTLRSMMACVSCGFCGPDSIDFSGALSKWNNLPRFDFRTTKDVHSLNCKPKRSSHENKSEFR